MDGASWKKCLSPLEPQPGRPPHFPGHSLKYQPPTKPTLAPVPLAGTRAEMYFLFNCTQRGMPWGHVPEQEKPFPCGTDNPSLAARPLTSQHCSSSAPPSFSSSSSEAAGSFLFPSSPAHFPAAPSSSHRRDVVLGILIFHISGFWILSFRAY